MSRTLSAADGTKHVIVAPTTTTKLASRMLAASSAIVASMPSGFFSNPALDILLILHVAEEDARYLSIQDIKPAGTISASVTRRWIEALEKEGLVDRCEEVVALSTTGYTMVTDIMQSVFDVQRSLD